jgi:hypothetical protein
MRWWLDGENPGAIPWAAAAIHWLLQCLRHALHVLLVTQADDSTPAPCQTRKTTGTGGDNVVIAFLVFLIGGIVVLVDTSLHNPWVWLLFGLAAAFLPFGWPAEIEKYRRRP